MSELDDTRERGDTGERRIGVYICHCGGNISDYVDVARVLETVKDEPGVVVAKTAVFTCSDATQQEMLQDIREQRLNGLVVASCSPKLHQFTFRDVAKRGEVNPYQYTQVNIREQCSWAHTDDKAQATEKAIRLVRAGIAKTRLSQPLTPIVVDTVSRVLVVGAGIAGLRAAIGLADIGLEVILIEKEAQAGGRVAGLGEMYPHGKSGRQLVNRLLDEVRKRPRITLWTGAELLDKRGSFGNFQVKIKVSYEAGSKADPEAGSKGEDIIQADVGAVIVATGFDSYQPQYGEFGFGLDGVVTLPEFQRLLDEGDMSDGDGSAQDKSTGNGPILYRGKAVKTIAYIYCVGSRQKAPVAGSGEANRYCSRYCCNAAGHAALKVAARDPEVRQYHLYRDVRTYGKFESIYNQAREQGSIYIRFDENEPPVVTRDEAGDGSGGPDGSGGHGGSGGPGGTGGHSGSGGHGGSGRNAPGAGLRVAVKDLLTAGEELDIPVDLVVLVTGMVPRRNEDLVRVLKLPVGKDGFYNEIHPKLRPVETVVDGVFICGTCQGPKNSAESVASALAASAQAAAILKKGYAELEPLVAEVDPGRCDNCGQCYAACPFGAIERREHEGREVAGVNRAVCKGCGGCVPACPAEAINLLGYTDEQIRAMIDALTKEIA